MFPQKLIPRNLFLLRMLRSQRTDLFMGAAGLFSAILLVLSFPPYSLWGLVFVGLVPLILASFRAESFRHVLWAGFTCMVFFIVLGLSWVSFVATNFGGLPWIIGKFVLLGFSFFAEMQYLLFGLLVFAFISLERKKGDLFLLIFGLPLAYVGLDYLYPKIFPITLGQSLYGWFNLAQLAEFGGVYGLTVPVLMANVATAIAIQSILELKQPLQMRRLLQFSKHLGWVSLLVLLCLGGALALGNSWGKKRITELEALESRFTKRLKTTVVQGNIGDLDKLASESGFRPAVNKVLDTYRDMSFESVKRYQPDLIIWPETAYPFLYTHLQNTDANETGIARDKWVLELVSALKTPLYFGGYSSVAKKDFNSAFLILPNGELLARYQKSILLAFGEYVPLGPLGPYVQELVPTIANFGRGPGPIAIDFKGVKLGPQICYEGIVPEFVRGSVGAGSDVLLNLTNDSWFGPTNEPILHLLLTVFRSIEVRRPMIRATNTGISTIVAMTGEKRFSTRTFEPAFIDVELKVPGEGQQAPTTFYYKHGDVPAIVGVLMLLVIFSRIFLVRFVQRKL